MPGKLSMCKYLHHSVQTVYLAKQAGGEKKKRSEELPFSTAKWIKDTSNRKRNTQV